MVQLGDMWGYGTCATKCENVNKIWYSHVEKMNVVVSYLEPMTYVLRPNNGSASTSIFIDSVKDLSA